MGYFPQTVAAKLAGREVAASLLVHMDFREQDRRFWFGFGDLEAGGHIWQGTGELIQIDGLEMPIGTVAPKATFTLSGIDAALVTMARNASDRVKDRRATIYIQFFDITPTDASVQPWSLLDEPFAVSSWLMDQMTYAAKVRLCAASLLRPRACGPAGDVQPMASTPTATRTSAFRATKACSR